MVGVGIGLSVGAGVCVGAGLSVGTGVCVGAGLSVGTGVCVGTGLGVGFVPSPSLTTIVQLVLCVLSNFDVAFIVAIPLLFALTNPSITDTISGLEDDHITPISFKLGYMLAVNKQLSPTFICNSVLSNDTTGLSLLIKKIEFSPPAYSQIFTLVPSTSDAFSKSNAFVSEHAGNNA